MIIGSISLPSITEKVLTYIKKQKYKKINKHSNPSRNRKCKKSTKNRECLESEYYHLDKIASHTTGTMPGIGNKNERAASIGHQRTKAHPLVICKSARCRLGGKTAHQCLAQNTGFTGRRFYHVQISMTERPPQLDQGAPIGHKNLALQNNNPPVIRS